MLLEKNLVPKNVSASYIYFRLIWSPLFFVVKIRAELYHDLISSMGVHLHLN